MASMIDTLTDIAEVKAFSQAQSKTIIELSRKNKEQADEIVHLKKLLEGSVPLMKEKKSEIITGNNDQEFLCRTEINKLRDISLDRELSLEEAKKLDIYSKILANLSNPTKTVKVESQTKSTDELLRIISSDE
jgi:hypothetical protein